MTPNRERHEGRARLIGVAVAAIAMALFLTQVGWPAPGISIALGFGAYLLARGRVSKDEP